ncbi:MAG: type VII secretion protein EccB [Bifidobacterium sp.]
MGVGLTVIAILVSLFYGMVSPSLPDGWENNKLIVAKNSAARYVSSNGTLHPVINAISARLLIPSSDFKVLTVADDQLKNIPIGSTIGILGAPDSLPEENNLIAGSINSCVSDSNVTTTLSNASSQVTDTATAIVANVDGISYLVNGSHRYQLPQEATLRDAFLRAFGIPETASTDATTQWINLFEQGSPIEQISVDGAGNSITVHGVEALVGSVVMQQGDAKKTKYVVRSDGSLSPLTDFTYGLYITGKTDEFHSRTFSARPTSNSSQTPPNPQFRKIGPRRAIGNIRKRLRVRNLQFGNGRKEKADTHVNLAVKQNNSAHSGTSKQTRQAIPVQQ